MARNKHLAYASTAQRNASTAAKPRAVQIAWSEPHLTISLKVEQRISSPCLCDAKSLRPVAQVLSVSDKWLLIFSQDPTFRPSREAADRALCTFKSMGSLDDEILAEFYEQTEFHSGFQNWSGVTCPYCAAAIEDWFFDSTSASFKRSGFANLEAVTPCCHSNVSLNDLAFAWPAGFSLFALKAVNCGIMPTPHQIDEIEKALGTKCRIVWERL